MMISIVNQNANKAAHGVLSRKRIAWLTLSVDPLHRTAQTTVEKPATHFLLRTHSMDRFVFRRTRV